MKLLYWILILTLSLYNINSQNTITGKAINGNGWVGLEFSRGVKISQISWTQQSEGDYLGIFEGANDISFFDALPLYMITTDYEKQVQIQNTQSFKYVRYVKRKDKFSSITSFQVLGIETESLGEATNLYTPTKIPLMVVHTKDGQTPVDKENQIVANIVIIKDGKANAQGSGAIKLRGNSTLKQEKKSFNFKFDEKKNVLGFKAKAKKWVLFANNYDKSLLRNLIGYKMSNLLGLKWAPQCEHVDMILNGEFIGNYLLCDKIEVNEDRVDIAKIKKTDIYEPEVTGGYILEIDGYAENEPFYIKTNGGNLISIKYPGDDTTIEQKNYIERKINTVEAELNNGILDNIDIDSFLKYFILQDFTGSPDSLWSSIYLTKNKNDEKIYFGPIWDLDLAFGNLGSHGAETNFGFKNKMALNTLGDIVSKILGNNVVLPKLKEFWNSITRNDLTANKMIDFIERQAKIIEESQRLNFIRWDILKQTSMFNPVARGSWEAEVSALKEFFEKRMVEFNKIVNEATIDSVTKKSSNPWGNWGGWGNMGGWGGQ